MNIWSCTYSFVNNVHTILIFIYMAATWLFLCPVCLSFKIFSLLPFHIPQAHLPQIHEKLKSCIVCLITCPAISLHEALNVIEEILHFVPPFCILRMFP